MKPEQGRGKVLLDKGFGYRWSLNVEMGCRSSLLFLFSSFILVLPAVGKDNVNILQQLILFCSFFCFSSAGIGKKLNIFPNQTSRTFFNYLFLEPVYSIIVPTLTLWVKKRKS